MRKLLSPWRLVILTLAIACIGLAPSFWVLWPKWSDNISYSHGLIVFPMCIWFLWQTRHEVDRSAPTPMLLLSPVLLGLILIWTVSYAANIEVGITALLPPVMLTAVCLVAGLRVASIVAFPILLLYSAIPVWDLINGLLQSMTTAAVTVILGVINVPAYIQGNIVQIPSGTFEIASGCSGLHFFVVGLTLAAVYGYLFLKTTRNRLLLFVVAIASSVLMNWIRVATIITAGHLTEMQSYLVQVDHYTFGWVLFTIMMLPLFWFASKLEDRESSLEKTSDSQIKSVAGTDGPIGVALLVVCIIVLSPSFVWGRLMNSSAQPVTIALPSMSGWNGPADASDDWTPVFRSPDGEIQGRYSNAGGDLEVYVNWYFSQSRERELIGYGNSVAGHSMSLRYDRQYMEHLGSIDAKLPKIREIMASSRSGKRLIWYRYAVGRNSYADPLTVKLMQGLRSIAAKEGVGLIAVSARCAAEDCSDARDLLRNEYANLDAKLADELAILATE